MVMENYHQQESGLDMYLDMDMDLDLEGEVQQTIPCPYCHDHIQIDNLFSHMIRNHSSNPQPAVCTLCSQTVEFGKFQVHIILEHNHLMERHQRFNIARTESQPRILFEGFANTSIDNQLHNNNRRWSPRPDAGRHENDSSRPLRKWRWSPRPDAGRHENDSSRPLRKWRWSPRPDAAGIDEQLEKWTRLDDGIDEPLKNKTSLDAGIAAFMQELVLSTLV